MNFDEYEYAEDTLYFAKRLHDMGRYDIVEKYFSKNLDCDCHPENVHAVLSCLFGKSEIKIVDEYCYSAILSFRDSTVRRYYLEAHKNRGKIRKKHKENEHVRNALEKTDECFSHTHCLEWRLNGQIGTKRAAASSGITAHINPDCNCDKETALAYGLLETYAWFAENAKRKKGGGKTTTCGHKRRMNRKGGKRKAPDERGIRHA